MNEATNVDDGLLLVGEDRGNRGLWIGFGAIGLGGLLLFATLEAGRQSSSNPQIAPPKDYAIATAPHPELAIPDRSQSAWPLTPDTARLVPSPFQTVPRIPPARLTLIRPPASPALAQTQSFPQTFAPPPAPQPNPPDPGRAAPVIVYDAVQAAAASGSTASGTSVQATTATAVGGGDRAYLVSQGTLIFAVLETAIDSTQAGQVRAIVSSNVYNGAGTQILIPRGSRIFGDYKGELAAGQDRAQIIWNRLIRPDGATISLDSPASDQLGRAGIKGRVNTHFGERLLGALLQSTIDFGGFAASRAVSSSNGVVVAIPSAAQGATSQILQPPTRPTLTVKHGTRIAVFVARDLDFSAVE